jgi:hypothetical protein
MLAGPDVQHFRSGIMDWNLVYSFGVMALVIICGIYLFNRSMG